jgi:hypothetical protein
MSEHNTDTELAPPPPTLKHDCAWTKFLNKSYILISLVPEDTIRILLATDNHIGYLERDPVRGQDSVNTFKEILQLAVKNDVCVVTHASPVTSLTLHR